MANQAWVAAWLAKADEDLGFASSCLADELEYFGHICFHLQQAAEKYLKVFVVARGQPLQKIHSLPVLLDSCCSIDPAFERLRPSCHLLNRYYVETRYPVHWPTHFTKADAEEARTAAEVIREQVTRALKNVTSG